MARGGSSPPQEDAWLSALCLLSPWIYLLATSLPCHVCFHTVDEPGVAWPMSSLPLGLLGALSSSRCRARHSILVWWAGTTLQPQLSLSMFPKVSAEENGVGKCALISVKWSCLGFYVMPSAYFSFGSESAERLKWITVEVYWGFTMYQGSKVLQNWGKMYQVSGWSVLDWPPLVVLNSHTFRSSEFNKWDPNTLNSFCRGKETIDRMRSSLMSGRKYWQVMYLIRVNIQKYEEFHN